jgi:glycosyltransferase involved in cell wall biosynthesis
VTDTRGSSSETGLLSVVLPTFNGAATIAAQLDALLRQQADGPWELVVIDNASTDGTGALVDHYARRDNRVRRVDAPDEHNLSYVRNVGAMAARGDRLAFVDDDDLVGESWLQEMYRGLDRWPLVAARLEYERLNPPEVVTGRGRFQTAHIEHMFGLPIISGATLGCHRWVWEAVGGNDPSFGTTGEDFDFAMRTHRATGLLPVLLPDAVYHCRLRTGAAHAFRQARLHGASHVQLYRRHAPGTEPIGRNARQALRSWWWVVSRAPLALYGIRRERWATEAGRRVGRFIGSIRHRTWLL